jgi:translation initiation factor 2 beta subunit (eIF-2beta)/eIF-5
MSELINIGGLDGDKYYRYKRNKIRIKHIRKNGGRTQIINMPDILKQLDVPTEFSDAYYKKVQKKKGVTHLGNGIFQGTHLTVDILEKILVEMINKYLVCPKCCLPEWKKDKCAACGYFITHHNNTETAEVYVSEVDLQPESTDQYIEFVKKLYDLRINIKKNHIYDRSVLVCIDKVLNKFWDIDDTHHSKWYTYVKKNLSKYNIKPEDVDSI